MRHGSARREVELERRYRNFLSAITHELKSPLASMRLALEIDFPLVVRPSYVLGGRAMEIVHSKEGLARYMRDAVQVSNESPVLLDHFLDNAVEVDVDAICDGEDVLIGGIMEHIEQAGVHSGEVSCAQLCIRLMMVGVATVYPRASPMFFNAILLSIRCFLF